MTERVRVVDRHIDELKKKAAGDGSRRFADESQRIPDLTTPDDQPELDYTSENQNNPMGAPTVTMFGKEIPLYTHGWSKNVLTGAANIWGLGAELTRSVRDRSLKIATAANKKPEVTIIDTEDLSVVMEVPIVQPPNITGSLFDRVSEATKGLVETGKYRLRRKLPPAEKAHPRDPRKTSVIIPTASSDGIKIGTRLFVARTRSDLLQKVNPAWPGAIIELKASAVETGIKMLRERNKDNRDLPQEVASFLMPDLDLFIDMRYMNRTGNISHAFIEFSFSENFLRFDQDGKPLPPATVVGGQFFHPALMSTKDFARVLSARFVEETQGLATIDPTTIQHALKLAPGADEDTRKIIEPYLYRMQAVGWINQLLTQHPSEFISAITRTVSFANNMGEPLSPEESLEITTEIIGGVLGLKDAPRVIENLTYIDFVTLMHRVLNDHRACLQWAGNSRLVSLAVDTARDMPELRRLVTKMGVTQANNSSEVINTMSSASFFALSITPELLFLKSVALLLEEYAHAEVAKAEARRTVARVQTIIDIVSRATDIDEKIQQATRDEFIRQTKRLTNRTSVGNRIGGSVADAVKERYHLDPHKSAGKTSSPGRSTKPEIIDFPPEN